MKKEHLKLLRETCVGWNDCEFGAPEIDPKRPYGNSGVYGDIAEILGISNKCPHCGHETEGFTEEQKELMDKLHKETETALQLLLKYGKIELGVYEADDYKRDWKRVKSVGSGVQCGG